jgi:hypothetical protein
MSIRKSTSFLLQNYQSFDKASPIANNSAHWQGTGGVASGTPLFPGLTDDAGMGIFT